MLYSILLAIHNRKHHFWEQIWCRNSLEFLEIPMSFSVTHTFFSFFFNSMYKTGKCCIYSCNWSFILTFVKLWEAEITGLARSQTFPGEQGLCSKDSVLSEMKKKTHTHPFVLFLHQQDRLGWLFRTALLHLMNACTTECMKFENSFWKHNSSVKINCNVSKNNFTSRVCIKYKYI